MWNLASLRSRLSRAGFLATVAAALFACPAIAIACESDTDCQGDRICTAGQCVPQSEELAHEPTESVWHFSADVSLGLGPREGTGAQPFAPGIGGLVSLEHRRFVAAVEFLAPWRFKNATAGLGVGVGGVVRLSESIDLVLLGMVGMWETVATNGTYKTSFGYTADKQFRTTEYAALLPHVRFGRSFHASIGPRIGYGQTTRDDVPSSGITDLPTRVDAGAAITFSVCVLVGYRW